MVFFELTANVFISEPYGVYFHCIIHLFFSLSTPKYYKSIKELGRCKGMSSKWRMNSAPETSCQVVPTK